MARKLLISDANILIDVDVGGLIEPMFQLPYEYATPDILYEEEIKSHHGYYVKMGLRPIELSEQAVIRTIELANKYRGVSSYDLSAFSLAEQEQAPLLTGDQKLRKLCQEENHEVHGTIWLVENMLEKNIIDVDRADIAYKYMIEDGSRLPEDKIKNQISRFKKQP